VKNKKFGAAVGIAVFCVLAVLLAAVWKMNQSPAAEGEKTVTVEVVHSDGNTAAFTYRTDEMYLGELLEEEGLISGSDSEYGLFVDTVDGETAVYEKDGAWWSLSCDGEDAQTGADSVALRDGSVYTWTYTVS